MSVRLAEVIALLDEAYPPGLAHDWDSVGLVCGDPDETIDSVTVAVDATTAVVQTVGPGGLLLAHHPLLLRGVDTVAASTPKGSLLHRLIRSGAALFTAHTNADAARPGVSDALAEVLGLTVEAVLDPVSGGPELDKWVIFVPSNDADAVRGALFAAGAGQPGLQRAALAALGQADRIEDADRHAMARRGLGHLAFADARMAGPGDEQAR